MGCGGYCYILSLSYSDKVERPSQQSLPTRARLRISPRTCHPARHTSMPSTSHRWLPHWCELAETDWLEWHRVCAIGNATLSRHPHIAPPDAFGRLRHALHLLVMMPLLLQCAPGHNTLPATALPVLVGAGASAASERVVQRHGEL